jgi:hypothetical protein
MFSSLVLEMGDDVPASYTITFLPDGRVERFFGSRGNYYEFADGSHLDIYAEPVWCNRCHRVTHGEAIPTIEALDQRLADLDSPVSGADSLLPPALEPPGFRENLRREAINEAQRRREWRLTRRSPPKCIHCGSEEIIALPDSQPVTVPTDPTPITIVLRVTGMCSTNFNEWFFTPEGDRIPRDTKPTYWQLPGVNPEEDRRWVRRFLERRSKRDKPNDHRSDTGDAQ